MVILYIAILCLGLIMALWGGYCVIKQNKYHFYGAIVGVYGSAIIGIVLALLLAVYNN